MSSRSWLVTGARGFLGRHVLESLRQQHLDVLTLDRKGPAIPGGLVADLAAGVPDLREASLETVVHLAGRVHTEATGREFATQNHQGTLNLLAGLDQAADRPRALIFASSVAVYGVERGEQLDEDTPCRPATPYGRSKLEAERSLEKWCEARGVALCRLRLPLIAGHNPPGNLGRMVRAIRDRRYLGVGAGKARRSMVLANDVAAALPRLAGLEGAFHLTDRRHPSFREIEECCCRQFGRAAPWRIPVLVAWIFAAIGGIASTALRRPLPLGPATVRKMTSTLTFDDSRAVGTADWAPRAVLEHPEEWTQ